MMIDKSVALLSLLVVKLSAQTDWDCNHFGFYPTDTCLRFGSSISSSFDCTSDNEVTQNYYLGSDCDGTPAGSQVFNSSYMYGDFQCDQNRTCDYMAISYYNDTECTHFGGEIPFVVGECFYSSNTSSVSYECTADGEIYVVYYLSGGCEGFSVTQSVNPASFADTNDTYCVQMTCNSSYTAPPTTTALAGGTIGPFDCNVALMDLWPLVENECSYIDDGGNVTSYMVDCSGGEAILYEYDSNDCSGDLLNMTYPQFYYCGATGDCNVTEMTMDIYDNSSDCSGTQTGDGVLNLAQISGCVNVFRGFYFYGVEITDSSVDVGYYVGDSDCDSGRQFSFSLDAGCNDLNDTSGYVTFSEFSVTYPPTTTDPTTTGPTTTNPTTTDPTATGNTTTGPTTTGDSGNGGSPDESGVLIRNPIAKLVILFLTMFAGFVLYQTI